jgi:enterobactin synthetase component D
MLGPARNPRLFPSFVAQHSLSFAPGGAALPELDGIALPAELERAVPKRKLEYLAGRYCARAAMRALGAERADEPLATGPERAPRWPAGLVGSISHSHGFVSAAVARGSDARGLGLDSERLIASDTASSIVASIARPGELGPLIAATGLDERWALTVVFSAKESIFKCLYPLVGRYFDFLEAEVIGVELAAGRFRAHLAAALAPGFPSGMRLEGAVELAEERVHTGMVLLP